MRYAGRPGEVINPEAITAVDPKFEFRPEDHFFLVARRAS